MKKQKQQIDLFLTANGSGDTEGYWFCKSGCFWMLPVLSGCRISRYSEKSQNLEIAVSPRKRFSQKVCFYCIKATSRKDQNYRNNHTKISFFHKNLTLWWCLPVKSMFFFHENQHFRFSVWLTHSMDSMESIDSMESEIKYIRWW